MKRVFVIHGRDMEAVEELSRFLKSLGLEHITFRDIANDLGPNPFIAEIVTKGISEADVVVALFTPDEVAALYTPAGAFGSEARWQARPNVLFEAGVAYGLARGKVVLATLGADVDLFSDVNGLHILRLDTDDGKRGLARRIDKILGGNAIPALPNRSLGAFRSGRTRWSFYDEMDELERTLRRKPAGKGRLTVFAVLSRVVRKFSLSELAEVTHSEIMAKIAGTYDYPVTNDVYWWLIVVGVFQFTSDGPWWSDEGTNWKRSVDYSVLTVRGRFLLQKIAVLEAGK